MARLGLPLRLPSEAGIALLRAYAWPGNVRELATLDDAMAAHIRLALERTQGRIEGARGAARLLAINPYTRRARMRKLGVNPAQHS